MFVVICCVINKKGFYEKKAIENDAALGLAGLGESVDLKRARKSVGATAVGSSSVGLTVPSGSSLNIQASPVPALTLEQLKDKVRTLSEHISRAQKLKTVVEEWKKKAERERQALRELRNAVGDQFLKQARINFNAQIKASTVAPKVLQASITTVSAVKPALVVGPKKTNVVQPNVLAEYWRACDQKDYRKVAEIISKHDKIRAFCRGAKQGVNSENAFHIVAKTNDLELFFALQALDVNPGTFVKKDTRGKIPLQVAIENNASDDVKKALACKTTIAVRFPEAIKLVCTVFGVPEDMGHDDLKGIQEEHAKRLRDSNLAKKYSGIFSNVTVTTRPEIIREDKTTEVVGDDISRRVHNICTKVKSLGWSHLQLTNDVPQWSSFLKAMKNDAKGKLAAVNTFLQWTSLQYLQTQENFQEGI